MVDERDPARSAARYLVERLEAEDRVAEAATGGPARNPSGDVPPEADRHGRPDQDGHAPGPSSTRPGAAGPARPVDGAAQPRQLDGRGRMERRGEWVDELVRQAMARGEFDDLPLAGKPIPGIGGHHDPDWWLKNLVERERITGVLPEALQLRTDDAALDGRLDRLRSADAVRSAVEEFNARIVAARRQLLGGPPVVTRLRDVEGEVRRWTERAQARRAAQVRVAEAEALGRAAAEEQARAARRPRWWRRRERAGDAGDASRSRRPGGYGEGAGRAAEGRTEHGG